MNLMSSNSISGRFQAYHDSAGIGWSEDPIASRYRIINSLYAFQR